MGIHDVKVAFAGVSHWHVPLYFPAMSEGQVQAVSDPDENIAVKFASQLNSKCYTDWQKMIDEVKAGFCLCARSSQPDERHGVKSHCPENSLCD